MDFEIVDGKLKKAWGYDERVVIPEGVRVLCEGVFTSFAYMEEIVLPGSLERIEEHAFNNCLELKSIDIPDGVSHIGEYAFQYCKKLESIRLPARLGRIASCTFRYCLALKEIVLPPSVSEVEYDAFFGCEALKSFSAPYAGCTFGRRAFYGCKAVSRLDAPASALMRLDDDQLAAACAGFCRAPEGYSQAAREAYLQILKNPAAAFMTLLCAADDHRALSLLTSEKLLGAKETDTFLEFARDGGAYRCVSALIEYKNTLGQDGIEDMMEELEL